MEVEVDGQDGLAGGDGGGDSRRCRVLALMIELSSALGEV